MAWFSWDGYCWSGVLLIIVTAVRWIYLSFFWFSLNRYVDYAWQISGMCTASGCVSKYWVLLNQFWLPQIWGVHSNGAVIQRPWQNDWTYPQVQVTWSIYWGLLQGGVLLCWKVIFLTRDFLVVQGVELILVIINHSYYVVFMFWSRKVCQVYR